MPDPAFLDLAKLQEGQFNLFLTEQDAIDRVVLVTYKAAYKETIDQLESLYRKVGLATPVDGMSIRKEDAIRFRQLENRLDNIRLEMEALRKKGVKLTGETSAQAIQDAYYSGQWSYEQAVGVKLPIPALPIDAIRAAVNSDVSGLTYIQTWAKNTTANIYAMQATIMRGITQGYSYTNMAREVKGLFDMGLWQAMRVIRTEAGRCWSEGAQAAHEEALEAGLQVRKRWSATLDTKTRPEHGHLDGTYADKDGLFWIDGLSAEQPREFGDPGIDINCIPEDAIPIALDAQEITKREYNGELISIKTAQGNHIRITPNHPILSDNGWISANKINVGTNIISVFLGKVFESGNMNIKNIPPVSAKVFDLFSIIKPFHRVTGSNKQFHGDGGNSDVNITTIDRHLWNRFQSAFYKPLVQFLLASSYILTAYLSCKSAANKFVFSSLHAAHSIMCSLRNSLSFFWRSKRHTGKHTFRPVSAFYSIADKHTADTSTINVQGFCDRLFGLPCKVSFDRVISVNRIPYQGHVYNLQTSNGYYGVLHSNGNMSIVHNCRCAAYDVLDDILPEVRRIRGEGIQPFVDWKTWARDKGWSPETGWPKVNLNG